MLVVGSIDLVVKVVDLYMYYVCWRWGVEIKEWWATVEVEIRKSGG